jgi:hypothetical protein
MRRFPATLRAVAVIFAACTLFARPAHADKATEAAAKDALKRAAKEYTRADYVKAAARLQKALKACGEKRCTVATKAALLRDLGASRYRAGDQDAARSAWDDAKKLQPDLELAPEYDAPDLRQAFTGEPAQAAPVEKPAAPPEPPPEPPAPVPEVEEGPRPFARVWIGAQGSVDFVIAPAAQNVCKLTSKGYPVNSAGYFCTNPDGSDFPTRVSGEQNSHVADGGQASGGFQMGDIRALLALDYAATANVLIGGRFGYVINSYPGQAAVYLNKAFGAKVHAELRGTYVFGKDPLSRAGFAPMAFVGGGLAEFDTFVTTFVSLDNVVGRQPANAWLTNGPGFAVVGGGMRYQFSPRVAATGAARINGVFGGNGFLLTFGPEVSLQYGF